MFKKLNVSRKAFRCSLICGLISAIFLSFAGFDANCEELRQNVLRLHIIANSDSTADQELKLKIRDRILESSGDIFNGISDVDNAVLRAKDKLQLFEDIANEVIAEEGFSYTAKARIGDSFFETREYEDFTLPAGNYKSLIIDLGKGEGKNWWCVIFPEICLSASGDITLSKTVSEDGTAIAENPNRYILRFKTVEIYEEIKKLFKK